MNFIGMCRTSMMMGMPCLFYFRSFNDKSEAILFGKKGSMVHLRFKQERSFPLPHVFDKIDSVTSAQSVALSGLGLKNWKAYQ